MRLTDPRVKKVIGREEEAAIRSLKTLTKATPKKEDIDTFRLGFVMGINAGVRLEKEIRRRGLE